MPNWPRPGPEPVTELAGASFKPIPNRPTTPSRHPLAPLFNVGTVRLRCAAVLHSVAQNLSGSYRLDRAALGRLAARVASHLQTAPAALTLAAPFWQHLQADGVDRVAEFDRLLQHESPADQARAWADLALLSVLLSADPGPLWRYTEHLALPPAAFAQATPDELLALLDLAGKTAAPVAPVAPALPPDEKPGLAESAPAAATTDTSSLTNALTPPAANSATTAAVGGSAGLALATFRAFVAGAFSADKLHPCRADAATLRHVDVAALRAMLQGTPQNPNLGLEGRAALLSRWGQMLQSRPGAGGAQARPCDLVPALATPAGAGAEVQAASLLTGLLRATAATWATAPVQGLPAGDVWAHRWAGEATGADVGAEQGTALGTDVGTNLGTAPGTDLGTDLGTNLGTDLGTSGWVPLHAAAQAMVGALVLPLQKAGCRVVGLAQLTASADHQACNLLLGAGVIVPRQQRLLARSLKLSDEAVVECRALTVALFDELTNEVRTALRSHPAADAAGLTVAAVVRATAATLALGPAQGHAAALTIESDGALF